MNTHRRFFFIFLFVLPVILCVPAVPSSFIESTTKPPVLQFAHKLLSNFNRFPTAIQEGMSGKTDEIRKIVSSALGGGLIGQLVENPIQAADNFGIDINQFGINKTMLEKTMGVGHLEKNSAMVTSNKDELLFSSQLTPSTPLTTSKSEPLYIDGHIVKPENEKAVLSAIMGNEEQSSISTRSPHQEHHRLFEQENSSTYYNSNITQFYKNQDKKGFKVTRRPLYMSRNNTKILSTPPPVVPAPAQSSTNISSETFLKPLIPFLNAFDTPSNELDVIGETSNDVAIDNAVQSSAIRRLPVAPQNFELHAMQSKIVSLEKILNDKLEILAKQHDEDKNVKVEKILHTIKFGKSSRLSPLQKNLRYSPVTTHDDLRLDTHPLSVPPIATCTCVPVKLDHFKGRWIQVLGSTALSARLHNAIGNLFNTTPMPLECSQIHVSPQRDFEPAYAHFVWGFRLSTATNVVRLPGNIFANENDQVTIRIVDFDDEITDIPLCVHKADQQYLVIAASDRCSETALLVKSPESFFQNTDAELTSFLQKKISKGEINRMELVEHIAACATPST